MTSAALLPGHQNVLLTTPAELAITQPGSRHLMDFISGNCFVGSWTLAINIQLQNCLPCLNLFDLLFQCFVFIRTTTLHILISCMWMNFTIATPTCMYFLHVHNTFNKEGYCAIRSCFDSFDYYKTGISGAKEMSLCIKNLWKHAIYILVIIRLSFVLPYARAIYYWIASLWFELFEK